MNYYLQEKDIEKIEKHYNKFFTEIGAKDSGIILHEIASDDMHIDIAHYLPTEKFPYHILATIGMSGYTMNDAPYKNIELIMFLPGDWKIDENNIKEHKWYWPIEMLKTAVRLPYLTNSFLSCYHTFSKDANCSPFDKNADMCVGLLTFPTWFSTDIFEIKCGGLFNKKTVNFLCLTAITKEEYEILKQNGVDYLLDEVLTKDGTNDLVVRNKR